MDLNCPSPGLVLPADRPLFTVDMRSQMSMTVGKGAPSVHHIPRARPGPGGFQSERCSPWPQAVHCLSDTETKIGNQAVTIQCEVPMVYHCRVPSIVGVERRPLGWTQTKALKLASPRPTRGESTEKSGVRRPTVGPGRHVLSRIHRGSAEKHWLTATYMWWPHSDCLHV